MESKELLAQQLYQTPYNRLSAFAQDRIDGIWNAAQRFSETTPQSNNEIHHAILEERISFLNRRISNLEMEYEEIWIENSELKQQLANLQADINQRSS